MKQLRIGILHQSVVIGDAIGNDVIGSYLLLERMGFTPEIVCEFPHERIASSYRVNTNLNPDRIQDDYDLIIYHHSGKWSDGEKIIISYSGLIVVKYHNVTPFAFFSFCSTNSEEFCRQGREQTTRMIRSGKAALWQSDSAYNAQELSNAGVDASINAVVPPFNRCNDLFHASCRAVYSQEQRINLLFVGRRAPHKGHQHLFHMMSSYLRLYSTNVRLRIVGSVDHQLAGYSEELMTLSEQLGITAHIEWLSHISDQELDELFCSSHVYVNASEHEGFCITNIEAQSIGLPVVTVDSTALRETTGPNQIVIPLPHREEDYDLMAGLVYEVATDSTLRQSLVRHGFKNVYERFNQETIENLFVDSLAPILRQFS
jgi:glycosyltransferase involved in cell wall biosynthesis